MKKTILAAALALLPGLAMAHGPMQAFYGGQIIETPEGYRIEFAVRDGAIRAWVRDHDDKPVKAEGKATILAGGKAGALELKAEGDSLAAAAKLAAADKVTAVLNLNVDGKPVAARFTQEALATPALSAQAQTGRKVFEQACASCHGTALRGTDAAPPLLHPFYAPGSGHGDDLVLAAIRDGAKAHHWKFGDMPKPEGVPAGREQDVLAYIRAVQAANGLGGGAAAPAMDHSAHGGMMNHGAHSKGAHSGH